MAILHKAKANSKENQIFTDWLLPGGSNPHSSVYTIEAVEPTFFNCNDCFKKKNKDKTESEDDTEKKGLKYTLFIWPLIHVKAQTMIAVVIAILAIDFPQIFGRPLCKSEEFGISLMDTGVALITLNAGMSGVKARPWNPEALTYGQWYKDFLRNASGIVFPLIVGLLRFCVVSDLDYQEHASEWGIHWNFYTTVAVISLGQSFVYKPKHALGIGVAILITFQVVLSHVNLTQFVFFAPRLDFISANREGILSCFGYLAL